MDELSLAELSAYFWLNCLNFESAELSLAELSGRGFYHNVTGLGMVITLIVLYRNVLHILDHNTSHLVILTRITTKINLKNRSQME